MVKDRIQDRDGDLYSPVETHMHYRDHVPYRDTKTTRILHPAQGGNANTAIICNITLAQILRSNIKLTCAENAVTKKAAGTEQNRHLQLLRSLNGWNCRSMYNHFQIALS
ncbi:kinesin-like protein KIN-7O isoform X2 [Tanacetum coccineum]